MNDQLKLSLAALAAFLLGLFVGTVFRPGPPDVRSWENRVIQYQRDSLAFENAIATLHGQRARLEDSARTLERTVVAAVTRADVANAKSRHARQTADSLAHVLTESHTAADSLPVVVAAYEARTEEATQAHAEADTLRAALGNAVQESIILRGVIKTQDSVITTVTTRLRIADDLLRDRPKADRCKVLWFNCPSRTTTFVVGAALGAAGALIVSTR